MRVRISLIFSLLLIFYSAAHAGEDSCMLPILKALSPSLSNAYDGFRGISPALLRGEVTPNWYDFEKLKSVLDELKAGKKVLLDAGQSKELDEAFLEIKNSLATDALMHFRNPGKNLKVDGYLPTEYALKREYQSILWKINRELPKELKIPGVHIPYDTRLPVLLTQAKQLVEKQEKVFATHISEYGYKDMGEFNEALKNHSELSKKLLKMFEEEDFEVAMNRPENARWWTPRVGFQNQRITGSSKGSLDNVRRDFAEAAMIHVDSDEYIKFDNQLKPNYGYLKPRPESGMKQSEGASTYGTDIYVFKKSKVRDRLTWTSGDSLSGHDDFIPWKDRNLVIPDLLDQIEYENIGFYPSTPRIPIPRSEPLPSKVILEKMPVQPEVPRFISSVKPPPPPKQIAFDYPTSPLPPSYGLKPAQPLLPPLKVGENFDAVVAKYHQSPEFLAYQEKHKAYTEKYVKAYKDYEESPEYKKYHADYQAIQEKNKQMFGTPEYAEYQKLYSVYSQQVQMEQAVFQSSPVMKAYQDAYSKYSEEYRQVTARNSEKLKAFEASPEGALYRQKLAESQKEIDAFKATDQYQWYLFNQRANPYGVWSGKPLEKFYKASSSTYVELQYWGPTTLDDVEAFEFKGNPPAGEFLQELLRRGIKIRDGRVQPAIDWKP